MTIEEGKKAPAFTLKNTDGKQVKLSDLTGKWVVLYFYPADDTPGCTIQAKDFTADLKKFEKLNATILGCSPDLPDSHKKFVDKYKLKIQLLSDPSKKMMSRYQAWGEKNMYGKITEGVIRSTVLIDPRGKIVKHWKRVQAKGHSENVRKLLKTLQSS
ncbi:MAG: peroxiredoxin [Acidiferrobacteraceae bacterium]|nr:peroxiredoxin [Acidiferrobacteraceae bacterium]|tara:strand:- start:1677 stop:2150 length:474 start_codon:yes stop_codon:yes gene_type:complete